MGGESYAGEIEIINDRDGVLTLEAFVADWEINESGGISIIAPGSLKHSLSEFTTLNQEAIEIQPGETGSFGYRVLLPSELRGPHWTSITVFKVFYVEGETIKKPYRLVLIKQSDPRHIYSGALIHSIFLRVDVATRQANIFVEVIRTGTDFSLYKGQVFVNKDGEIVLTREFDVRGLPGYMQVIAMPIELSSISEDVFEYIVEITLPNGEIMRGKDISGL